MRLLMGSRRSVITGEHRIAGPRREITIRRDKHGIPTIEAHQDHDAFFGLGFVQYQDRGFQLETLLRVVRGTLSEMVGKQTLAVDRIVRRIGFFRSAKQQLDVIDTDIRHALEAFTSGINAAQAFASKSPPHEFQLLKILPTPWEPADVLGLVKLQTFLLPSNWDVELARLNILLSDGPDALRALDPAAIGEVAKRQGSPVLFDDLNTFLKLVGRGGGSNNWVISGSRTKTGKPILANDPHLAPSLPAPWYLAHVNTPEWAVAGAALVGAPVFPIAHNGFACWGVTAGLTDNTDLVLESSTGEFDVVEELICVSNGPDEVEKVRISPRGPVITAPDEEPIALRAVWLAPLPVRGFFDSPRARSFDDFRKPFAQWPSLPMNLVYADETGATGWQLVGQLPIRKAGSGTIPLPPEESIWDGWIPFEEMPFAINPPEGFLATANDPPSDDPSLGIDFIDRYRAELIREALSQNNQWDVELCSRLQYDVRSRPWDELREIVLALPVGNADLELGLAELQSWNGRMEADSPAATIFELFVSDMCIRLAKAKAPKSWKTVLGVGDEEPFSGSLFAERRIAHLSATIRNRPDGWFESSWEEVMSESLTQVIRTLRATRGPGPAYWQWGDLRQLRLEHPIFKDHWLGRVFNAGPVPVGGDSNTVLQAAAKPYEPLALTHNIPNLRAIFDVSNWSNSRFVLAGGQSGNPCDPHYEDLFALWQAGSGVPIPWTTEEVIRGAVASLRLSAVEFITQ